MTWDGVPGLVEVREAHGETTLVVETAQLVDAALHLRDTEGFNFLSDVSATDYLGWGGHGVAGYWGHRDGRNLNEPGSWGFERVPDAKPKRFSVSYHLLALRRGGGRVRLQVWVDEDEPVPTVVEVWPTADWHERENYDLMGIVFEDHPNLRRIIMDDDWEGNPLRKDYPIGGEPVRFSGEE